jgi:hypothetical protein
MGEEPLEGLLGKYTAFFKEENYRMSEEQSDRKAKVDLIEFLIIDTMFALSKIIETISPTIQTTLFSESYMGSVYAQLFECNQIFDYIYLLYKWCEPDGKSKEMVEAKIKSFHVDRKDSRVVEDIRRNYLEKIHGKIVDVLDNKTDATKYSREYSKRFFDEIVKYIDKADMYNNITNYLLEMALRKYKQAREMHHEGGTYQELMNNMYYLEDNLSNNTCQFYFAVERYYNNCGFIAREIKKLKSICKVSSLYKIENHIHLH